MEIGVITDVTEYTAPITDLARAVEDAGLESLFITQHTHVPASRTDLRDDEFHRADRHLLDPFVTLGAAGAVTSRIKLGTGICLVAQYDPIILAKQVATLDYVSRGRFLFGVGAGWLEEEMRNHGLEPRLRWRILRERVLAMKRIWTEDEAAFHGDFVNFDAIWMWPKPIQKPHPPVLIAGSGPRALDRVVEFGDGWIPLVGSPEDIEPQIAELAALGRAAGRAPLPVTATLLEIDEPLIRRCGDVGVGRCIIWLPAAPLDAIQPLLERCARISGRQQP